MNCFYHPSTITVATCQDCGKGLCVECASQFQMPICIQCNENRKNAEIKAIKDDLSKAIAIGVLLTLFEHIFMFRDLLNVKNYQIGHYKFYALYVLFSIVDLYFSIGIVVGWKNLNKLTPRVFLVLPLIGWLIYFIIKVYAAMFVGLVSTPFWFARKLKRLKALKSISYQKI
jgi:hypothetical protein